MGHFLLSMLILSGSTPLGNMASRSAELNSDFLVQDKPHKPFQCALPAYAMVSMPSEGSGSRKTVFGMRTIPSGVCGAIPAAD